MQKRIQRVIPCKFNHGFWGRCLGFWLKLDIINLTGRCEYLQSLNEKFPCSPRLRPFWNSGVTLLFCTCKMLKLFVKSFWESTSSFPSKIEGWKLKLYGTCTCSFWIWHWKWAQIKSLQFISLQKFDFCLAAYFFSFFFKFDLRMWVHYYTYMQYSPISMLFGKDTIG